MSMDDEVDISQLMAFAESIDFVSIEEDLSDAQEKDVLTWNTPDYMECRNMNMFSGMVSSTIAPDQDIQIESASPQSPIYRARASLFGNTEHPLNIELCGENLDPRSVCILDQPGRYAQFKHWLHAGVIADDTRRITKKEDNWQLGCWQSDELGSGNLAKLDTKSSTTLDRLLQRHSHDILPAPLEFRNVGAYQSLEELWKEKSFLLSAQIMVSMNSTRLTNAVFPKWCLWLNDKLCEWNLGDRAAQGSGNSAVPMFVNADIDLSHNDIGDEAIFELSSLLSAFPKVRVKSLRLSSIGLSDSGLLSLSQLPYLQHLVVQANLLSSPGIVSFAERELVCKEEYYEVLLAQDAPDERVLDPLYMMVEYNEIDDGLALVKSLEESKLAVCIPDSIGCQPLGVCRTLGKACRLHLCGIGCQSIKKTDR